MSSDEPDDRSESASLDRFADDGPTDRERGDPAAAETPDEVPEFDEGRYLYCLVQVDEGATLETTGVDGEPVSVVAEDGVGAIVHTCDGLYDSADLAQVRRWLVRHQTVVDEAGEAFGTPIPFQFDTILRGDDERVREWLREESATIERALEGLADHWEYRVEVAEVDPIDDDALIDRDDGLRELEDRIDEADEGTRFLLEKKRDQRLTTVRAARRESVAADLESRLEEVAREVHALERSPTAALADDVTGDGEGDGAGETLCRFTILAHAADEGAVGSVLDDVAAIDGLEVRFTGPWPPYTFAPELGNGDGEDTSEP